VKHFLFSLDHNLANSARQFGLLEKGPFLCVVSGFARAEDGNGETCTVVAVVVFCFLLPLKQPASACPC
jgi:hypothetical protein